ncbi:MAG: hypothetical protein JWM77_1547 [Rhodospirillales bacterium]|nr:hypothetical protein [Rhodospirillales bacterium]
MRSTKQTYEFQTLTQDLADPALRRPMPRGTLVKVITTTVEHTPAADSPDKQVRREVEIPEAFFQATSADEKPGTIDVTDQVL